MKIRVTLDDAGARAAMQRFPQQMTDRISSALERGAMELAREARRLTPKAFSTLTNSIRETRLDALHYQVATGVNYARLVEEGRQPGKQPGTGKGLMEWVKFRTRQSGKPLERTTFLIARAIGRKGIRPQPYMQPAFESQAPRIIAMVQASARAAAQEFTRV